jgi:transcriptional regulator with XRE-family HTH domain
VDRPAAVPDPARVSKAPGSPLARRLGAAIIAKRRILGLSQEQLAARAGLHRTYLAGVEGGKRNPSLQALDQIATGLGVPLSELSRLTEAMHEEPPAERGT